MAYVSRIPADEQYLAALGRAFYNFTYLEWTVISTIARLDPRGFEAVPQGQSARYIARALAQALERADPPVDAKLSRQLREVQVRYLAAIRTRNQLLHAHPFTDHDGAQQLSANHTPWTTEGVQSAAQEFEEAALFTNGVFHGALTARNGGGLTR